MKYELQKNEEESSTVVVVTHRFLPLGKYFNYFQ